MSPYQKRFNEFAIFRFPLATKWGLCDIDRPKFRKVLRIFSKKWEVLERLNKTDFSQIEKFELSLQFHPAKTSQNFENLLSIFKIYTINIKQSQLAGLWKQKMAKSRNLNVRLICRVFHTNQHSVNLFRLKIIAHFVRLIK